MVVLSGPSFASELARKLPTAIVAAGDSAAVVESVMAHFRSPALRLYGSSDVIGVELGGSLKNIIAIAAGVVEGLGLGHNALAALITRGLAELSRLAVALGAQRDTLAGLAGLGDLVLTCTGDLSRNRRVGLALAKGQALQDILAGTKMVAEGVRTTEAALALEREARHRAPDRERNVGRAVRPHRSTNRDSQSDGPQAEAGTCVTHLEVLEFVIIDGSIRQAEAGTAEDHAAVERRLDRLDEMVSLADTPEARTREIDVDTAEALEEILLMADVGVAATGEIVSAVEEPATPRRKPA